MRKLAILLGLVAFGMSAQTTQTINSQLKLNTVPDGTTNDAVLVKGSDNVVKKVSKTALFATIPLVVGDFINDGATTIAPSQNAVFDALAIKANDGSVVHKDGYEVITGNKRFAGMTIADGGFFVKQNDNSAYSVIDAQSGKIKFFNNSGVNFIGEFADTGVKFGSVNKSAKIDVSGLTADRIFTAPNSNGTLALKEETMSLTGNQTINGVKAFIEDVNFYKKIYSPSGYSFFDSANDVEIKLTEYDGGFTLMYGDYDAFTFAGNEGVSFKSRLGGFNLNTTAAINKSQAFINSNGEIPVVRATAPTSSMATGVKGEIYVDANYVYYCYAPNSWRRVAGTTF